jgi:hypothetical protein
MPAPDTPTLDQAVALARRLSPTDQLRLIGLLAPQVARDLEGQRALPPFPVIEGGAWPADLPLRREELYGDDGR